MYAGLVGIVTNVHAADNGVVGIVTNVHAAANDVVGIVTVYAADNGCSNHKHICFR